MPLPMRPLLLFTCWLISAADPHPAVALEQRCYRQQLNGATSYFSWQLDDSEPLRLQTSEPGERYTLVVDRALATRSWQVERPGERTCLRVERQGNELVWSGTHAGQPLERRDRIDDAPWFQALSLSLQQVLEPGRERLEFWMIRPDTLELHKLRAERRRPITLEIAGETIASEQIRISVPGIPAFVWHSDYWFDPRNGRFLRFAGRTGLPGSPDTVVELAPEPACSACLTAPGRDAVQ